MKFFKIIFLLVPLMVVSSCVSKKKYDDLSESKRKSDMRLAQANKENRELEGNLKTKSKEAKKLDNELAELKEEFNDMKNEMLENNARKSSLIEELNRKLSLLSNDHKSAKDSLQSMLARLDKRDKKYKERQKELAKKLGDLDGIDVALNDYSETVQSVEKFISHNIDKNGIPKVYTMLEGGFVKITFDENGLFNSNSQELESDGKRALKIIAAALENNSPINAMILANWSEATSGKDAWIKTEEKANAVFDYLNENSNLSNTNLLVGNEKFIDQKLGNSDHEIAIIIYPTLNDITKFAE
ncbi:MAG: hypothetical protein ACPGLV_16645 [Bacteroidia bacterium]